MGTSGISTGFPVLSRSSGQVAHVLLTRSPLRLHQCCHRMDSVRLACVRHAASVRPEPGSNSPSRPPAGPRDRPKIGEPAEVTRPRLTSRRPHPEGSVACQCIYCIDSQHLVAPKRSRAARTGFWLSLFRFQGTTGAPHQRRWCRVLRGSTTNSSRRRGDSLGPAARRLSRRARSSGKVMVPGPTRTSTQERATPAHDTGSPSLRASRHPRLRDTHGTMPVGRRPLE